MIGVDFAFTEFQKLALEAMMSVSDLGILTEFLTTPISSDTPYCVLKSTELNGDKEHRKSFHSLIREQFGAFLVTDTFEDGKDRSLRVWIKKLQMKEQQKYKSGYFNARDEAGGAKKFKPNTAGLSVGVMMKDPWPADRPCYLHFRMYKENRDTAEAIQSIARCLGIPPKSFQFAGTKDRRGITVQGVSVYRVSIESMRKALLNSAWDKAVRIAHLEYIPSPLRIGSASGNHFKICLRKVSLEDENINEIFTKLETNGFLNYYGLQRFGNRQVKTHHVGALILAGEWKTAVDLLLGSTDCLEANINSTRNAWMQSYAAGDIETAYNNCPSFMYIEKALLRSLHFSGQSANCLNAIQSLPATTTHMYLHAVQSYVFNAALSHRIKVWGRKVVVGDLVVDNKTVSQADDPLEEETDDSDGKVEFVKTVETEEEALMYSIEDVVQTLVGSSTQIPPNMKDFYSEIFESKFACPIASIVESTLPKFLHLKGAYRRMVSVAKNLKWAIVQDVKDTDILIRSDVDRLMNSDSKRFDETDQPFSKAVVFECSLNSGCYLTMALREVSDVTELKLVQT